jgi:hypothetical protein
MRVAQSVLSDAGALRLADQRAVEIQARGCIIGDPCRSGRILAGIARCWVIANIGLEALLGCAIAGLRGERQGITSSK